MKKFFLCLMTFIFIGLFGLAFTNWKYDELGILRGDFSAVRLEPDQHVVKMRHVLSHPSQYDSFAFGSSRVAKIDLTRIPEGTWYNMSYSEGMPDEWLADLQQMLDHGVNVRRVLIGLDDGSFRMAPDAHENRMDFRRPYRPYDVEFYLNELFKKPKHVNPADVQQHGALYDIYKTGRSYAPASVEAFIDEHPAEHAKDERLFLSSAYVGNHAEQTLATLQKIKELADEHHIELTIFFNPMYQTTYVDNDLSELASFKRRLASIVDYYDFCSLNGITTNPSNYYESSHYRPPVGDLLIDRIFLHAPEGADGFGTLVTTENIEDHLSLRKSNHGNLEIRTSTMRQHSAADLRSISQTVSCIWRNPTRVSFVMSRASSPPLKTVSFLGRRIGHSLLAAGWHLEMDFL